ncbi:MAG: tetratricopeptide repeat protein, partial [Cyclobacteriaceae bacterium]|nr:tetratricopeptide repeat protein [Cyclobacteriaceae bacterium]
MIREVFFISCFSLYLFSCTNHREAGKESFERKDYEQAAFHYHKVVAIEPHDHFSLFNLARAYEEQGDFDRSIKYYSQSIRQTIDPYAYEAYVGRARCYWKQEMYDYALIDLNNALSANPRNFESRYYRGRYYLK